MNALNSLLSGLALGALLTCAVGWIVLRARVFAPLQKLRELTGRLDGTETAELCEQADAIGGMPGEIARVFAAYAEERDAIVQGSPRESPEHTSEQRIVDEICQSLLPQKLKKRTASLTFSLAGGIQQGTRRNCAFYDYFFLDENTLCTVVGQVPGNGIAEALFAVVAQTAVRSRLRMGRSLIETMSDVSAQLYDFGGRNVDSAFVAAMAPNV